MVKNNQGPYHRIVYQIVPYMSQLPRLVPVKECFEPQVCKKEIPEVI
jgi:hypothetical protein